MDVVWELDEASVRDGDGRRQRRGAPKPRAYTTYMTILGRLHAKGLLDVGARARPTSTARSTRATSTPTCAPRPRWRRSSTTFGDVALSHFARQMAELDPERRKALERLARER